MGKREVRRWRELSQQGGSDRFPRLGNLSVEF